jgi:hypothetical protein
MATYDIVIPQVDASADFNERVVNVTRGGLLTATADANRLLRWLAAGSQNDVLSIDANGDLVWVAPGAGHTQNTDTGTTSNTFTIDSDSTTGKMVLDVALNAGENRTMTITNAVMTGDVTITIPAVTGTLATQAYADGLFAANDAMLFKGTIGTGGTHEIAAFNSLATYNAGWTYRVITAGTVKGIVCQIGDVIMALVDRAGTGELDADWTVMQTNLDGAVIGPASVTDGYVALFDGVTGKLLKAGTGALGTMAYATATDYVAKALYDANTILYATTDNTPAALTIAASTIVGRKATGDIVALTPAEAMNVMYVAAPASKTAAGTTGQIAWDDSYLYLCVASNSWKRNPIAFW